MESGVVAQFARQTGAVVPPPGRFPLPSIRESRLEGAARSSFESLGSLASFADADRRAYSLGKSYPDLLAARSAHVVNPEAELPHVCDAVARPRSEDEISQLLQWAGDNDVAVVPVGGGTSVVGGIEPVPARDTQQVVSLDMRGLDRLLGVDEESMLAHVQAGILGPALESALGTNGLTLGHVPQSFHRSSLGGWIATRSAGQQSLMFGRIEDLVAGLRVLTPSGPVQVDPLPAHAAGPHLVQLVSGSEGTLGVISRATVRVSRRPEVVRFATFAFPSFADGVSGVRDAVQRGLRPGMVRLSDSAEAAFSLGSSLPDWLPRGPARELVSRLGYGDGCLAMVVMPGWRRSTGLESQITRAFSAAGGRHVGTLPTRSWYRARFVQPLVRDLLIDRGLVIDTLETAVPWSMLLETHAAVRSALHSHLGEHAVVTAHVSHCYRDGASLYFTFLAQCDEGEHLQLWRGAKRAVAAVLLAQRAAVSHQHGVGVMHARLYEHMRGAPALDALQSLKQSLDPRGILNPGKAGTLGDIASALNAAS